MNFILNINTHFLFSVNFHYPSLKPASSRLALIVTLWHWTWAREPLGLGQLTPRAAHCDQNAAQTALHAVGLVCASKALRSAQALHHFPPCFWPRCHMGDPRRGLWGTRQGVSPGSPQDSWAAALLPPVAACSISGCLKSA